MRGLWKRQEWLLFLERVGGMGSASDGKQETGNGCGTRGAQGHKIQVLRESQTVGREHGGEVWWESVCRCCGAGSVSGVTTEKSMGLPAGKSG